MITSTLRSMECWPFRPFPFLSFLVGIGYPVARRDDQAFESQMINLKGQAENGYPLWNLMILDFWCRELRM